MSLVTPEKIRTLQRALYEKAKQEPTRRFHCLYDKVWRKDILAHAYALSRANGGDPGVDGETFARIEVSGVDTGSFPSKTCLDAGRRVSRILSALRPVDPAHALT